MKKKSVIIFVALIFLVFVIAIFIAKTPRQISGWEVTVEPSSDPEHFSAGVVSISFPYQENGEAAESKLDRILNGQYIPHTGQYEAVSSSPQGSNYRFENGRHIYSYELWLVNENSYERGVPSIRQGENKFCFYALARNGGILWNQIGYGSLTVILPENHELVNDVSVSHSLGHKDNDFSIFTSAPELSKSLENNRWTITAVWEEGKFAAYYTDLYLEIYYRKV